MKKIFTFLISILILITIYVFLSHFLSDFLYGRCISSGQCKIPDVNFPFKNIYPSIQKTGEQEREELFSPVLFWKN